MLGCLDRIDRCTIFSDSLPPIKHRKSRSVRFATEKPEKAGLPTGRFIQALTSEILRNLRYLRHRLDENHALAMLRKNNGKFTTSTDLVLLRARSLDRRAIHT